MTTEKFADDLLITAEKENELSAEQVSLITELVETKEMLAASNKKVATLEDTLSNLIHDINQPLTGILGFAHSVLKKMDDGPHRDKIAIVEKEALRLSDIVDSIDGERPQHESKIDLASGTDQLRQRKILLVDDDDMVREGYKLALDRSGLEIAEASSGKQALELMNTRQFDLVMTDLKMPDMDGIQLIEVLKAAHTDLLIIGITGWLNKGVEAKALAAGAERVLKKPIQIEKLIISMAECFEKLK